MSVTWCSCENIAGYKEYWLSRQRKETISIEFSAGIPPKNWKERRHFLEFHDHFDQPLEFKDRISSYALSPLTTTHLISTMSLHHNNNTGSSTCVISPPVELKSITKSQDARITSSHTGLRLSDADKGVRDDDSPTDLPSPTTQSAMQPERWNHPRSNLFKTMAAFWSFVVMGSNDAAYGALIPYVSHGVKTSMKRANNVSSCKHTTTSPLWLYRSSSCHL